MLMNWSQCHTYVNKNCTDLQNAHSHNNPTSHLKKKWLVGLIAACVVPALASISHVPLTSQTIVTAEAATVQHVHVVRNVWLRRTERIAKNGIHLEHAGTALTVIAGGNANWWHVRDPQGRTGYIVRRTYFVSANQTRSGSASQLPPGVTRVYNVKPRALPSASTQAKINAVLSVARSKIGTPYRWGHNEDRGRTALTALILPRMSTTTPWDIR